MGKHHSYATKMRLTRFVFEGDHVAEAGRRLNIPESSAKRIYHKYKLRWFFLDEIEKNSLKIESSKKAFRAAYNKVYGVIYGLSK
jgi:hypothetical protein